MISKGEYLFINLHLLKLFQSRETQCLSSQIKVGITFNPGEAFSQVGTGVSWPGWWYLVSSSEDIIHQEVRKGWDYWGPTTLTLQIQTRLAGATGGTMMIGISMFIQTKSRTRKITIKCQIF